MDNMTDRGLAYQILLDIFSKNELSHIAIKKVFDGLKDSDNINKPFVKTLVSGVCEYYESFGYVISKAAGRKIDKIKPQVRIIISMGLYQGYFMSVPISAACNESVKLAKKNGFNGLSGFVNGVLRGIFRNGEDYVALAGKYLDEDKADIKTRLGIIYSIPVFMIDVLAEQFGTDKTESILKSFIGKRNITIVRIKSRCDVDTFEKLLTSDNIDFRALDPEHELYEITSSCMISGLAAYKKGYFIVQDMSSFLAGKAIKNLDKPKVLDMCAAPGGKLIHCADIIHSMGGQITGRDISDKKVGLIKQNIDHVGLDNVKAEVLDASVYVSDDQEAYDLVLADLPCSGLGVMGKKPDIKYKTSPADIKELAKIQRSILENAVRYVKKGGYLLFSTCTLTKDENADNAAYIVSNHFESVDIAKTFEIIADDCMIDNNAVSIMPTEKHDGFFVALFRKVE